MTGSPIVLARATREGLQRADSFITHPENLVYRNKSLGISFHRPPSWTVGACDCSIGPYKATVRVLSQEPPAGEGGMNSVSFATTTADAKTARAAVIHSFGADDPRAHSCMDSGMCATVTTSHATYNGVSFERLDFGFYESGDTVLLTTTSRGTLVLDFGSVLEDDDPSIALILGSLRIS